MKTAHLISTILFLAVLPAAFADRRMTPVEYHGSATRIQQDGSIGDKDTPYISPRAAAAPFYAAYGRLESPSADGGSNESGFGRFLYRLLCPTAWMSQDAAPAEEAAAEDSE